MMTDEDLEAQVAAVQAMAGRLHRLEQFHESDAPAGTLTPDDVEGIARVLEQLSTDLEDTRRELRALGTRVNSLARHLVAIGARTGYDFPKQATDGGS